MKYKTQCVVTSTTIDNFFYLFIDIIRVDRDGVTENLPSFQICRSINDENNVKYYYGNEQLTDKESFRSMLLIYANEVNSDSRRILDLFLYE